MKMKKEKRVTKGKKSTKLFAFTMIACILICNFEVFAGSLFDHLKREPEVKNSYGRAWFNSYWVSKSTGEKGFAADLLVESNYNYGCSGKIEFVNRYYNGTITMIKKTTKNAEVSANDAFIDYYVNPYYGKYGYTYLYTDYYGGAYRFNFHVRYDDKHNYHIISLN